MRRAKTFEYSTLVGNALAKTFKYSSLVCNLKAKTFNGLAETFEHSPLVGEESETQRFIGGGEFRIANWGSGPGPGPELP